ncbi:L-asparaginase [Mucidula mucida]|nr:L-asparaginase [Mucidula mucida]
MAGQELCRARTRRLRRKQRTMRGGEAMDASIAAVSAMEDNILFNAGRGAVFNTAGKHELEASLMLSKPPASHPEIPASRRGLGVTLLTRIKNPCQLARQLYLSPKQVIHAFMSGEHAEELAQEMGFEFKQPEYFFSQARWNEHRKGLGCPMRTGCRGVGRSGLYLCCNFNGGRTNKLVGRVGDTPMMAAGFWAEQWIEKAKGFWSWLSGAESTKAVGISGTGNGDYFIRQATGVSMAHRVMFRGESLQSAADNTVADLRRDDGDGGVIALDQDGNIAMAINCPGMYRGFIKPDGVPYTAIFSDDPLVVHS